MTESEVLKSPRKITGQGIAAIVSDDYQHLLRIENLRHRRNLTPWLRRRQSVEVELPLRLHKGGQQVLRAYEMLPLIHAARRGATHEPVEIRIHSLGDRAVVHAEQGGFLSATTVHTEDSEFRTLLSGFRKKYRSVRLTVLGRNLATVKRVMEFNLNLPVAFYREGLARPDLARGRDLREILVLTNIAGSALPHVEKNLDFWSRGVPGFRFRHIFGQLTRRRVESALRQREWDCVIYRGHGRARTGGIYLELQDGLFKMPVLPVLLYIHLACLTNFHKLELEDLPATRVLTPFSLLSDFEDRRLIEVFCERYRISGSLDLTMRALQAQFPEFASFTKA